MAPAMASATSTRRLQVNRQARLMAALAVDGPAILRPIEARLGRSVRTAAATKAARVRDWLGRRFEVTQTTHSTIDWWDTVAPSVLRRSVGLVTPIVPHARSGATVFSFQECRWG
jgi:hypothetical protein